MNKFKKILLGTLSVLTLGLFVVAGTKVNAADTDLPYYAASDTRTSQLNAGSTIASDANLKVENIGTKANIDSFTINSVATKGMHTRDGGGSGKKFLFTAYNKIDLTVKLGTTDSSYSSLNSGKTVTFGSTSFSSTGSIQEKTITLEKNATADLYAGSARTIIFEVSYSLVKDIKSLVSFTCSGEYGVGDTVTKDDLTLTAMYDGDTEATATSKYNFVVYKKVDGGDDTVVTDSTFTEQGTYYIIATSTENSELSLQCADFTVSAQTRFVYDCNAISLLSPFNADTENHDYTTADNVITFNTFKKYSNTGTYTWDDGVTHNSNGLQGSTLTISLAKAARITFHATQTGGTAGKHDIRYMYFEDEDDNCIVSEMNFTISSSSAATKKAFSVNLPAGTYNSHSTDGGFNFYDIIIDYTDSSTLDTDNTLLILEHSTGTALSGTGTAARFVGKLENVNIDDITSITLDLTLTLSDKSKKNASITITSLYTGLPGYDEADGTLYFYYVITGLERDAYAGCSINGTATVVMGSAKGFSSTTWTNA